MRLYILSILLLQFITVIHCVNPFYNYPIYSEDQDIAEDYLDFERNSNKINRRETPSDDSWNGRWFPDKVTAQEPAEGPKTDQKSNDDTWNGRWFPDKETAQEPAALPETNQKPNDDGWNGRWFPDKVTAKQPPGHVVMGLADEKCDDAESNLEVDWDGSSVNFTCFSPKHRYLPDPTLQDLLIHEPVSPAYRAPHFCMDQAISYSSVPPTHGAHRPLWARYGEYKFLPVQRWMHNLEHGAVVMLYHPCAHPEEVRKLRKIVTSCLYRYVITPYNLLSRDRPVALVTWGWALLMSSVDPELAVKFIREHALHGAETTPADGQYDLLLLRPAMPVSLQDLYLCPNM